MGKKEILDSWILTEMLMEGDLPKGIENLTLENFKKIKKKLSEESKKDDGTPYEKDTRGLVLYLGIYKSSEIDKVLKIEEEEKIIKNKYMVAVCFDSDCKFIDDGFFYTMSSYLLENSNIEDKDFNKKFKERSEELKNEISSLFEDCETEEGVKELINNYPDSKIKKVNNIEADITNLHSFFIEDLNKAKTISTHNLDRYFDGLDKNEKINLDIKESLEEFNSILEPKNYPLGRFLSNPKHGLSLMQQIAVNLSVNGDKSYTIRSVNGPPGTGKTTLLKDIFADFIVSQAYEICKLEDKRLIDFKYGDGKFDYIKILPTDISDYNIVVASSNNGAVQNIVNELPLLKDVDKEFLEEIKKMNYFADIMNEKRDSKEINEIDAEEEPENIKEENLTAEKWGLFSLEGGKKRNISNILTKIEKVRKELKGLEDNTKKTLSDVYDKFLEEYDKLKNLRENIEKYYECVNLISDKVFLENDIIQLDKDNKKEEINIKNEREILKNKEDNKKDISINTKPSLYAIHKFLNTNSYKNYIEQIIPLDKEIMNIRNNINNFIRNKSQISSKIIELENKRNKYNIKISKLKEEIEKYKTENNNEDKNYSIIFKKLTDNLVGIKEKFEVEKDNNKLQIFNPWFNTEIRKLQTKLFIKAMAVKKQFLKDNSSYSLYKSKIIWDNQKKYENKKELIEYAWRWINFTIPVISTTFASFSRMFSNLNENSIPNLFIDEGGQALPQAAIGGIFRSKKVMVVGDPLQITPVLTVDNKTLTLIGERNGLKSDKISKFLSKKASVQSIVDDTSKYGFYYNKDQENEKWVGIPLWVHRRSKYPMFTISNRIAYNDLMVQGVPKPEGKANFIDVQGKSNSKFVEKQAQLLYKELEKNKENLNKIYIISPFKNVIKETKKYLEGKGNFDKNFIKKNIGTVHTFQGREADIVYFMLGCDKNETASLSWAFNEPNLVNVAATRAKNEFYIIGDKKLVKNLGSETASITIKTIEDYNKK